MWTARYRAVPPKIDRRRPIKGEIDRRRSIEGEKGKKKKKRKRRKEKKRRIYFSRDVLARRSPMRRHRPCPRALFLPFCLPARGERSRRRTD
ncbi:hypothetical protein B296_00008533 [Ensete ventricosum]|uniref:Uncharacterized protein n=1 Tax=Ensete ventricosum TaxID=4639 RepID=A0A427ANC3_ENSVE|nr:hypothetical protein B296_00008533 [Ensete ventricosum]